MSDLVESWRFLEKHWNRQPIKPVIDRESSYPDALIPAAWMYEPMRTANLSTRPANEDLIAQPIKGLRHFLDSPATTARLCSLKTSL